MKLGIIVQCRFNSSRFKGKILKKIQNKTILEILIERLNSVENADDICIAISDTNDDIKIQELVKSLGVNYFIGSETDVLSRHYLAAKKMNYNFIMRVTSDCPLIDPKILDTLILEFKKNLPIDYLSNAYLKRTFPLGMEAEIFTFEALKKAFLLTTDKFDREHVTTYIKRSNEFKKKNYENIKDYSKYRFTLDTKEDFDLIKKIFESLYNLKKNFHLNDIISLMQQNPNLFKLNNKIKQNT